MKMTLLVSCLSFLLIGCSKTQSDVAETPDNAVVDSTGTGVTNPTRLLQVGNTLQLELALLNNAEFPAQLVWNNSQPAVATLGHRGFITAVGQGETVITLTYPATHQSESIKIIVGKPYEVFVAGIGPGSGQISLWNNGVSTVYVSGLGLTHEPISMEVRDNDFYFAGLTGDNTWPVVSFWKNHTVTQLTDPNLEKLHWATGLAVSGLDVFVSGYEFITDGCLFCPPGSYKAYYWKTTAGVTTTFPLIMQGYSSDAADLVLRGTDVYIAGSVSNLQYSRACYWKNGPEGVVYLTNDDRWSKAAAISVQDNSVAVVGRSECADGSCPGTAMLWRDGTAIALTDGTSDATATCLVVAGEITYVGGHVVKDGIQVAILWQVRDGAVQSMALTDGTHPAIVNGLTVSGKDIFLAGAERDRFETFNAKYWRIYEDLILEVPLESDYSSSTGGGSHADAIYLRPL